MKQRRCRQVEQVTSGDIVVYVLRPDQLPRHPEKEWRGNVLHVYPAIQMVRVVSLEEGYEGCEDDVWLRQIIRIEKPNDTAFSLIRKEDQSS